jgi:RecA-family ATPase
LKPLKKILGNYILEGSVILFPSERGTGKTFFGLQACIAVSSKWKEYCGEEINFHGNTLFVNCELNEDIISRRATKLFESPPYPIDQSEYKVLVYTTRNSFETEVANIINIVNEYKPILIVLDNYRMAFLNSDTNNNKEAAKAMSQILLLRDKTKATILLTDHTRKHSRNLLTNSDLQAGSGTKSDLSDSDMFLRRSSQDKNFRILKRDKSRNCEESTASKLLLLNPETLWFECIADNVNEEEHLGNGVINDEDEKFEIAKELRDKGKSYDKIAQLLNVSKSKVYRWFK